MTFKNPTPSRRTMGALSRPCALGLIALAVLSAATSMPVSAQHSYFGSQEHGRGNGANGGGSPHRIERMLSTVNTSDAQREQIKQILKNAADDRSRQREAKRALREQAIAVFTAPVVDAQAAERVRQQMLAQQDQSSQQMLATMLAVSRVLTPEQRVQLAAHIQQSKRGRHDTDGN